jgi:chemotaxis protein methyltransferase CheR
MDAGPALSDREMTRIVQFVYEKSGITLHDGKRALVVARLQKRLKALDLGSYSEYLQYVERDRSGEEIVALLDAIATNHTYFFREEQHFGILANRVVPEIRATHRPLDLWCAASSTGEEPYTLAMTLAGVQPAIDFSIMASDISTKALKAAQAGVYKRQGVEGLSVDLLKKHFDKGMGESEGLVRVKPALRDKVQYRRLNLLEINSLDRTFDVIFCRNVMIYFDLAVQQRVVSMLERHLRPGGYLFISHSESLNGVNHRLRWIAPAAYQAEGA